jgi:FKBP-type peptidyl-prolyl cis-trans isomerase
VYLLGYQLGMNIRGEIPDLDHATFYRGLRDAVTGVPPPLRPEEGQRALQNFRALTQERRRKAQQEAASANRTAGDAFRASEAKRQGVKATASGLLYEVLAEGKGEPPRATDKVTVHYEGKLIDGRTFDSSYDRKEPTSFGLDEVIPGWSEGVQLMRPGAKHRLVLPPDLAYGPEGAGDMIGPDSTLVFTVELLSIDGPAPLRLPGMGGMGEENSGHSH